MCCWQWKLILGCSQVVRLWLNETLKPVNLYYLSNQAACQTFQSHLHVLVMQCEGKVIVAWEHFVTVKFCKVSNNIWVDFHRLLNIKAMAKKKPNQITSCICITNPRLLCTTKIKQFLVHSLNTGQEKFCYSRVNFL